MARTIVGVDISTTSIRAVEVATARAGSQRVVRFHDVTLPAGAVQGGQVVEVNSVASALRQLWSTGGFRSRRVVLGVGDSTVLVRELTVPRGSLKEIRSSLPFHVGDILPVPVADATLDFYPVSESVAESGPVVGGLLVAVVTESVRSTIAAVLLAGLTPLGVELVPFALSRLLDPRAVAGVVALVDVGARSTHVVVLADGVPQFVRIIPAGGADLTSALAEKLMISQAEAERVKRQVGLTSGTGAHANLAAAETIRLVASELLGSVRNTLSYYLTTRSTEQIRRVVITGGGSRLTGFAEALAEITRLPVATEDPLARFDRTAPAPAGDVSHLATALGLALGSAA